MDAISFFHQQAEKSRAAALEAGNEEDRRRLEQLARHYEGEARRLNLNEIKTQSY